MHFLKSEDTLQLKVAAQNLMACSQQKTLEIRDKIQATIDAGGYDYDEDGEFTEIASAVNQACKKTMTILPEDPLLVPDRPVVTYETEFQVRRRTALEVAKELLDSGNNPIVLNFAGGLQPGVTPRFKERTQEELNCRSSALLKCIQGSAMYTENRKRGIGGDYSSTCILSPGVPVFMKENGQLIRSPFLIDFITCAAPMKDDNQPQRTIALLRERITRILEIAKAYQYKSLVLGAWGCGGCGNDPAAVAFTFFQLLTNDYDGAFEKVIFAIAENRDDHRNIEPFKDFFCQDRKEKIKRLTDARSCTQWLADWIRLAEKGIVARADVKLSNEITEALKNNHKVVSSYPEIDALFKRDQRMPISLRDLAGRAKTAMNDAVTTLNQVKNRNPFALQQLISTTPLHSMKVKELLHESGFRIGESHLISSRAATYGMVPQGLHGDIREKLLSKYPDGLYQHQCGAIETFLKGSDLCLATSTASGKSLIFMALAAHHLKQNPQSRVIAVYPQRALTQDQMGKWNDFIEGSGIIVGLIDGSVKSKDRLAILERSQIVVMTPDVVQSWMMRILIDTRSKLKTLGLLILDECHLYTEILGTNMAYLLRRIRCVAGNDFRMIAATATVGDPAGMIRKLTGRDSFVVIGSADETSPAPEKNILLAQYDDSKCSREQKDAAMVSNLAKHYEGQFLVFVDSRQRVERIARLASASQIMQNGVFPYRSGYEANDRHAIQVALSAGNLKGVITTSALEVGVDIGDIDLVVILGYPPSVKSFWQRFGRAGRRADRRCDCVVVDPTGIMSAADGGIAKYMAKPVEKCLYYMENRFLRYGNVLCAASEQRQLGSPIPNVDELFAAYGDLPREFSSAVLNEIDPHDPIPRELLSMKPDENTPIHLKLSLRQVMEEQYLIKTTGGIELERISASQRFKEAYPGAIYRHQTNAFRITKRKRGEDMMELVAESNNAINQVATIRNAKEYVIADFNATRLLRKSNTGYVLACDVQIHEKIFGFKEGQIGNANFDNETLYNPNYPHQHEPFGRVVQTTGVVISLPEEVADPRISKFLLEGFCTIAGVSPRNVGFGAVKTPNCPFFKQQHKAICIYDDVQGGFRLTEPLFEMLDSVVKRAGLIASDSDDPHKEQIVGMIESFGRHLASLEGVQIQTGLRGESVELVRQEGQFHLVIAPGQEVILHADPDKRTFEITSVFLTPDNKIKYRTSANRTIEHGDIFVAPGETLFGWFDPNEGDMLPANKGPLALSIESIRILRPSYTFTLKTQVGVLAECVAMEPMIPFQNNDVVLICDPRIPSGYGIGKWLESVRKNGDSTVLSCRLRSLDPQSFEDIWSGEFIAGIKPDFGWWAVQRA